MGNVNNTCSNINSSSLLKLWIRVWSNGLCKLFIQTYYFLITLHFYVTVQLCSYIVQDFLLYHNHFSAEYSLKVSRASHFQWKSGFALGSINSFVAWANTLWSSKTIYVAGNHDLYHRSNMYLVYPCLLSSFTNFLKSHACLCYTQHSLFSLVKTIQLLGNWETDNQS